MTISAATEREFKFDVDADFDPPDLRPVVGRTVRLPEVEQHSTYYDTADFRLWARGITLRHRLKDSPGSAGEWTLKLPEGEDDDASLSQRSELTWAASGEEVPAAIRRILAGVVRRAPLDVVARLDATRRRLLLQAPESDQPWAEIDDDLVTVGAGPNAGLRFRQIEIELLSEEADRGVVDSVLREMRQAGAGPGGASKLGAALGFTNGGDGGGPGRAAPSGKTRMADVVTRIFATDLDRILEADLQLRLITENGARPSAAAVQGIRRAFRRLQAHLRVLDALLDPVWVGHMRADVRSVDRALGRVADADALAGRLRAHTDPADRAGVEELIHLVSGDRDLAAAELVPLMAGSAYLDLLERLSAAASKPPLFSLVDDDPGALPAGRTLRRLLHHRARRLDAEIAALGPHPDDEAMRQVESQARRLRYAAEAAVPYLGGKARRVATRAKKLQEVLAQIGESATVVVWLRELASHPSIDPAAGFVAGRIAGQAEGAASALRSEWPARAAKLRIEKLKV